MVGPLLRGDHHPALPTLSIFDELDADLRSLLQGELECVNISGGRVLFEEGQDADAMYFVVSGILGVVVGKPIKNGQLVAQIHAGEMVGEMALLSQRPRSATVIALRDTSLLRLSKEAFPQLMYLNTRATLRLASVLVDRLERANQNTKTNHTPRTIALIPLSPSVPIGTFAEDLASSLASFGAKVKVLEDTALSEPVDFFYSVEMSHHLTLYQGRGAGAWDELCIRRADRIALIAPAMCQATECALINGLSDLPWRVVELVLLHNGEAAAPAPAKAWLTRFPVRAHYSVRQGNGADFGRLARYLTGVAVGLVLSGGGARGYGHIGVLKALEEAEIPVDLVGGVSFGSIVAGAVASEWSQRDFRDNFYLAFVQSNPDADYTVPFVALTKGREVSRRFRVHFGDSRMEDLWRPCFAVAANLTTGTLAVQRDGPVWQALCASVAIPGLLPPWIADGEVLVDGGVMNNLPTDVMRTMCSGILIASDVTNFKGLRSESPKKKRWLEPLLTGRESDGLSMVGLLLRAACVSGGAQTRICQDLADVLLELPLEGVGLRDWKAYDRAVEAGYKYATTRIDELRHAYRNSITPYSGVSSSAVRAPAGRQGDHVSPAPHEQNQRDVQSGGPAENVE